MLALILTALAHVPHAPVLGLVAPESLDASEPWRVLTWGHAPMLLESLDGGRTFESIGGQPIGDLPYGLAGNDTGTLALLGATQLWLSTNSRDWTPYPLPGSVQKIQGEGSAFVLAGSDGIWRVTTAGVATQESAEEIFSMRSGTRVTALTSTGKVLVSTGSGWSETPEFGAPVTASFLANDVLYAGAADGTMQALRDGAWVACGAIPGAGTDHSDVAALTTDGTVIAVVSASGAVSISTDDCATFAEAGNPDPIQYSGPGAPHTGTEVVSILRIFKDALVLGGWNGLAIRAPRAGWRLPQLMVGDYVRGVALGPGRGHPSLYIGGQSAGPARSLDGGATWTAKNHRLFNPNVQAVAVDVVSADVAYAVVNHEPFRTADGGNTWLPAGQTRSDNAFIRAGSEPCEAWGFLEDAGQRTVDCGRNWVPLVFDDAQVRSYRSHQKFRVGGEERWCVLVGGDWPLWCSASPEGPFSSVPAELAARAAHLTAPNTDGPRVILAGEYSIIVSDDGIETARTTLTLEGDRIYALSAGPSGAALAGTLAGQLYLSLDSGDTWDLLPGPLSAPVWEIATSESADGLPFFVAATLDGIHLVSPNESGSWGVERMPRWQRVDDHSGYWQRDGCADNPPAPNAAMDSLTRFNVGCRLTTSFRGRSLLIYGESGGASAVSVMVDGIEVAILGTDFAVGLLYTAVLPDGWHELVLTGINGSGFRLDAIESTGDGVLLPGPGDSGEPDTGDPDTGTADTGPEETGSAPIDSAEDTGDSHAGGGGATGPDCQGCRASGGPAAGWFVAMLLAIWQRRSARTASRGFGAAARPATG